MTQFYIVRQFFDRIPHDPYIGTTHIALFMAMIEFSRGNDTFHCYGRELRSIAKIGSSRTYHKILRELVEGNYIEYEKGKSRWTKSTVRFLVDSLLINNSKHKE